MLILGARTDKPESELYLCNDEEIVDSISWEAHRKLAETIHLQISELLKRNDLDLSELQGIVMYEGPGSFTGLRIGMSVVNALSYGLPVPVVAAGGDDWLKSGIKRLLDGDNDNLALPQYGAAANITRPKR